MLTRCLPAALLAAVLFPGAAYADPVSIGAHVEGGTTASLTAVRTFGNPNPLGQLTLPTDRAALAIANGGPPAQNCVSEASARGGGSMKNPGGAALVRLLGDDGLSLAPSQAGGVGIFLSNNPNNGGGSGSGDQAALDRSTIFVGGPGNGSGNDGQVLIAVIGTPAALRALFGLRNFAGSGLSLAQVGAADLVSTPEPASMLLIGTGLAGLAAMRRRRRRTAP